MYSRNDGQRDNQKKWLGQILVELNFVTSDGHILDALEKYYEILSD